MANKLVYRDYAIGAKENASVDMENTDQQLIQHGETFEDDYNAGSVFNDPITAPVYASFEGDGIPVSDATVNFYVSGDLGFVSDVVSDGNGNFATPPKLTILLSGGYYTGRGLTLYFSGSYCSSLRISYYHDGTLLRTSTHSNSEMTRFFPDTVELYNKIVIEFLSTERPYQFAKVWRVDFGRDIIFERFKSINHCSELDPFSADLPIATLEFEINSDEPLEIQDDQQILLYHNDAPVDTFWISDSSKQAGTVYRITADNIIGRLENAQYLGEMFSDNPYTANIIASRISEQCGITINLDSTLASKLVRGHLPINTGRYAVMQLAFALNAIVLTDAAANVYIKPISVPAEIPVIDSGRILGTAAYTKNSVVTRLDLTQYYYDFNVLASAVAVGAGSFGESPVLLKLNQPTAYLWGTYFRNTDDAEIPGSYDVDISVMTNYAYGTVTPPLAARIYGQVYTETQTVLSRDNPDVTANAKENVKEYSKYTLQPYTTTPGAGEQAMFDTLYNRTLANRGHVEAEIVLNGERVGDIVGIQTKYDGVRYGIITKLDTDIGYKDMVAKAVIQEWLL